MQFEREGVQGTGEPEFDLRDYLRQNGLSDKALAKMQDDISSGDMNVNTLKDCTHDELISIANDCNLTILQKNAFIRAVTSLKLVVVSNNTEKKENDNDNDSHGDIYISAQDEKLLNDIDDLKTFINQFIQQQSKTKKKNKNKIELTLSQLKQWSKAMKDSIDNIVSSFQRQVCYCVTFVFDIMK